jgi:type IV fimbrial biogenesis protein FimT
MKKAPNNYRGFTLIELMITLAIAAILLTVGVPSFNEVIKNSRMATSTNKFITAANLARSEAIKRSVRVTVCKSNNGTACTNANNWDQGWIVFTDENNNAAYNSATETLLRVASGLGNNLTLTGNANVANYLSYTASGQSQLIGGAFQAGTFSLCDGVAPADNDGRNMVLSRTGRLSLTTGVACP